MKPINTTPLKDAIRRKDDPTRLSYWFPLIERAGIPVPRTVILPALEPSDEEGFERMIGDGTPWPMFPKLVHHVREAAKPFGFPFFLRTDYTSAKHGWKDTCFVDRRRCRGSGMGDENGNIEAHICNIAEFSLCCDMIGLPIDRWIVREFLDTEPAFRAFAGMPITKEFRAFVRDGKVEHVQPYWPPHAIEEGEPDCDDWREKLELLNRRNRFDGMTLIATDASKVVPGYWSVDLLWSKSRGWVVTDMAEGEKSYKWEPEK